jgi:predicted HD superfamily hydrolase involved in NAD metabolism
MDYTAEKVIKFLKKHLDSAKYKHSLGVVKMAAQLAANNRIPLKDAELAAALHDLGRIMKKKQLVIYAKKNRIWVPYIKEIIKYNPALLHGLAGAYFAGKKFTKKKAVLDAVAYHTAARAGMSKLSKLIYVADYIAPDRRFPGVDKIRKLAMRDLDGAFRRALGDKITHVVKNKKWLHPGAVEAWNELVK